MHDGLEAREGDLAAIAIHVERRADALRALAGIGWHPAEEEGEEEPPAERAEAS